MPKKAVPGQPYHKKQTKKSATGTTSTTKKPKRPRKAPEKILPVAVVPEVDKPRRGRKKLARGPRETHQIRAYPEEWAAIKEFMVALRKKGTPDAAYKDYLKRQQKLF